MKRILIGLFLFCTIVSAFAAKVDSISVFSTNMKKHIPVFVILPETYNQIPQKFASLYMLHGYYGDYASWTRNDSDFLSFSDQLNMIFICPDGGLDSWYIDNPKENSYYATFIGKELVHYIDSAYKTINDKSKRGICGVSMGGQGALRIGMENPQTFGTVISMSGVVDLKASKVSHLIAQKFGENQKDVATLEKHSVINQNYDFIKNDQKIIMSCGTADYLYPSNKKFYDKVNAIIPVTLIEIANGAHDWETFKKSFALIVDFL